MLHCLNTESKVFLVWKHTDDVVARQEFMVVRSVQEATSAIGVTKDFPYQHMRRT